MWGWRRFRWFERTGLPSVQPSPNLPTLDALTLDPGRCPIEGATRSEGRDTTRPFESVGAPWLDPDRLAEEPGGRRVPGSAFRPAFLTPAFGKHAGGRCAGDQLHRTDRLALRPVELGVHLVGAARRLDPAAFGWVGGTGNDPLVVDLLLGGDGPRRALVAEEAVGRIVAGWADEVAAFERRRRPFLRYARRPGRLRFRFSGGDRAGRAVDAEDWSARLPHMN